MIRKLLLILGFLLWLLLFAFIAVIMTKAQTPAPVLSPQFTLPAPSPLAIWHLGDPTRVTKENPAGWYTEGGGVPGTHAWQDGWFERALPTVRKIGAGKLIVWDSEGHSLGQAAQYVGNPKIAPLLNPGFDYDRFFKRLRAEKLEYGILIRANQKIVNGKPVVVPAKDMFEHVRAQAAFAVDQWKVSWIYVDSNSRDALPDVPNAWVEGWLMPNTTWPRLNKEFEGVRFVPEHKDAATYLWTTPYHELRLGTVDVPGYVIRDIPRAVGVINCSGVPVEQLRAKITELRASVRAGNILALDAWWPSPESAVFAQIYQWN